MPVPTTSSDPISDEAAMAIADELRAKPDDMRTPQENLIIQLVDMVMESKRRMGLTLPQERKDE
jgi:hypothetical protein